MESKQFLLYIALLKVIVPSHACGLSNASDSTTLLRLNGLSSPMVGRLEICLNQTWSAVIAVENAWTLQDSTVVCRSLGYQKAVNINLAHERFPVPSTAVTCLTGSMECTGREEGIEDCRGGIHQLTAIECDAENVKRNNLVVLCADPSQGDVRLIGSTDSSKGIVEVYTDYYGWSTLCTDGWDDTDATVVCKSLGFAGGRKETTRYSFLNLPMKRFNYFDCDGNENGILDCPYAGPYPDTCYSAFPARLSCTKAKNHCSVAFVAVSWSITLFSTLLLAIGLIFVICFKKHKKTRDNASTLDYKPMPLK